MARIAKSLGVLRSEFDALAPHRKKARDGWIGDAAHASRASRHNPNAEGVVCALDITDDVEGGCPVHIIAASMIARLQAGGETNPDLEYVISNGRVASRTHSPAWSWAAYHGADPHDLHVHFAVGRGPDSAPAFPYDDTIPWNIASAAPAKPEAKPQIGDSDMRFINVTDGPDKGKVFFLNGDVRSYVANKAEVDELVEQGVPLINMGAANWGRVVSSTALDIEGLRRIPNEPWKSLLDLIGKVSTGDLSEDEIKQAVKSALREGIGS